MSKSAIKADYIKNLIATYPAIYTPDSKPLNLAGLAADQALAGKMKLEGDCWFAALKRNNVQKAATMKMLSELPD